jgi:methionine-rich copper-binding protein CopC
VSGPPDASPLLFITPIRNLIAVAWLLGAVALAGAPALAEVSVLGSAPADGASGAAPSQLELNFSAPVERALCSVTLAGPGQLKVLLLKPEPGAGGRTVVYKLPPLKTGSYEAWWRINATGERGAAEGVVRFTVTSPGK